MDILPILRTRRLTLGFVALSLASSLLIGGCSNAPFPKELESGKVSIRLGGEPLSFDPSVSYNAGDGPLIALINPSFFRYKFLKRSPFEQELNLGAAMPTVVKLDPKANGGATQRWVCPIRKDLRFQDDPCFKDGKGRAVTAADIVYAFKRMVDPSVASPVSSFLADKVIGWEGDAKAFTEDKGKAYDRPLTGIRVDPNDPYTFTIDLNQPYPQLRFLMSMAFTSPQAREAVERYGDQYALHHSVGCGPFMMKEYVAKDHIWLVKNPNAPKELYPSEADPSLRPLLADAGKQLPFVDGIYLTISAETVTNYNLFQQGYIDSLGVAAGNAQIIPAANGLTQGMKDHGVQLNKNVEVATDYLAFNMEDATFGGYTPEKRKLRQAISLSIDQPTYINVIGQGMGLPAQWIVPPGLQGYDPNYKNPYRQFDPKLTKAKALLVEAGYPNGIDKSTGKPLVLRYDNYAVTASARQQVRLYQKMIQRLGIRVELNSTQYSTFNDRINKRQVQFFSFGWLADYPDPENFTFLLYGPNASPGPNACLYDNKEYNKLFESMRAMNDGPERVAIIKRMRDISVEDCPWIYATHSESRTLVQPWIRNQNANALASDQIKYVSVDPQMRTRLQAEWNKPNLWPIAAFLAAIGAVCIPAYTTIKGRTNRRIRKGGV